MKNRLTFLLRNGLSFLSESHGKSFLSKRPPNVALLSSQIITPKPEFLKKTNSQKRSFTTSSSSKQLNHKKFDGERNYERIFYLDQIRHTDDPEKRLEKTLIAIRQKFPNETNIVLFLSHAWPDKNDDPHEELWTQIFSDRFAKHLRLSIKAVDYDRLNSKIGGKMLKFMERIITDDAVILLGTRTLLKKHLIGIGHNICIELNFCHRRIALGKEIFPMVIAGNVESALPPEYQRYASILSPYEEDYSYASALKRTLGEICGLANNPDFEAIWFQFLQETDFLPLSKSEVSHRMQANVKETLVRLCNAIKAKDNEQTSALLEIVADNPAVYNGRDEQDESPVLCLAIKHQLLPGIIDKFLRLKFIDPNACDMFGRTALYYAAQNRDIRTLSQLISNKEVEVDPRTENGITPFYEACYQGFFEGITLLATKNANVEAEDRQGSTPLIAACFRRVSFRVIELILRLVSPSSINHQNLAKHSALFKLIEQKADIAIIRLLVAKGANIHQFCADYGHTALHKAVDKAYVEAIIFLLECGANVFLETLAGRKPIDLLPPSDSSDANADHEKIRNILMEEMGKPSPNPPSNTRRLRH